MTHSIRMVIFQRDGEIVDLHPEDGAPAIIGPKRLPNVAHDGGGRLLQRRCSQRSNSNNDVMIIINHKQYSHVSNH